MGWCDQGTTIGVTHGFPERPMVGIWSRVTPMGNRERATFGPQTWLVYGIMEPTALEVLLVSLYAPTKRPKGGPFRATQIVLAMFGQWKLTEIGADVFVIVFRGLDFPLIFLWRIERDLPF